MRGGRIAYLDGIRGAAILAVIAVHWVSSYFDGVFRGGYVGVDLFLVLSGFVITSILWRGTGRYGTFLMARIRRLYPALLGAVLGGLALVLVLGARVSPADAVWDAGFALTQMSSVARAAEWSTLGPFGHLWSLSVEWVFYLVWPLAITILKLRRVGPRYAAAIALAGAGSTFIVAQFLSADWFYYGAVSRSAQLLLGGSLALWAASGGLERIHPAAARWIPLGACVAGAALLAYVFAGPWYNTAGYRLGGFPLASLTAALCIIAGRTAPDSLAVRMLQSQILVFLGRISYSLYLWHYIALNVLSRDRIHVPLPVLGAALLVLTAATTWASYRWLEKPFLSNRSGALAGDRVSAETSQVGGSNVTLH